MTNIIMDDRYRGPYYIIVGIGPRFKGTGKGIISPVYGGAMLISSYTESYIRKIRNIWGRRNLRTVWQHKISHADPIPLESHLVEIDYPRSVILEWPKQGWQHVASLPLN